MWEQLVTAMRDMECETSYFFKIIGNLIHKHVPSRNLNNKQQYSFWYMRPLIKFSGEKCKNYKKWKRENFSDYFYYFLNKNIEKLYLVLGK